jgi:quercetin dioxygenase-like cupin family protein
MKIVQLHDVESSQFVGDGVLGVSKQVPVGVDDGSPTMSMRVITVEPCGYTPHHSHPWEHLNYILKGSGVMVDGNGVEHQITAGMYAFVPPDEEHQFRNASSKDELQFICLVPKDHE